MAVSLAGLGFSAQAKTLNFGLSGNPDTLDPHKTAGTLTFQTVKSIYDTLVEPDPNGKIVPALAEKWEVSSDELVWTFQLRKGVVFHNGDKLSGQDVTASFARVMDKETAAPKAAEFKTILSVEAPAEHTVVIRLKEPSAPFLATLASGWASIMPQGLIASGHDFATKPVGTGPFRLKEWVRDNRIVLVKNPNYWMKGLPKLDQVAIHIIPERSVKVQGIVSGQLHVSDIVDKDDVPLLESSRDVTVTKNLTSQILVMAMNCSHPVLKDLRVRQAINHAIDKQKVLDVAYGGGRPVGTFMDYGNPFYKDFTALYPYDPGKAKKLLADTGVKTDTVLEISIPQNYELHVKAGEMYQDMLSKAGLNVRIKLMDWSTWLSEVYKANRYDLTVIGHTGKLDPDGILDKYGTEARYVRWIHPRAAELIDKARKVSSFESRKALYDEVLALMAQEVPFVHLGTSYRYVAFRKNVEEFRMTPNLDTFDFRWTDVK
ncbi:MAG: ABC transporter substrate-binding protein [Desulfobacterales bacterium]